MQLRRLSRSLRNSMKRIAILAVPLLLLRVRNRKDSIPLTPFLAAGAIAMLVLTGSLVGSI